MDASGIRVVRGRRPVSLPAHGGYDEEHRRGGESATVTSDVEGPGLLQAYAGEQMYLINLKALGAYENVIGIWFSFLNNKTDDEGILWH